MKLCSCSSFQSQSIAFDENGAPRLGLIPVAWVLIPSVVPHRVGGVSVGADFLVRFQRGLLRVRIARPPLRMLSSTNGGRRRQRHRWRIVTSAVVGVVVVAVMVVVITLPSHRRIGRTQRTLLRRGLHLRHLSLQKLRVLRNRRIQLRLQRRRIHHLTSAGAPSSCC